MMKTENAARKIDISTRVLSANDRRAEQNRLLFGSVGLVAVDIMGSPGGGKTALLEATVDELPAGTRAAVIVGDIATENDAHRLEAHGIRAIQIVTEQFGGACHLEASTLSDALVKLDLSEIDLLFIENVGNLVCPAEFDLGQDARVVVLSVAEGEDKPLKYPLAFRVADLVIISKTDLVPHLRIDIEALRSNILDVNPRVKILELSSWTKDGLQEWIEWLIELRTADRKISR